MVVDIIVMSPNEEFICWLDSTTVDLEETSQSETIREISLEHRLTEDTIVNKWYRQGNKIWIGGGHGLKPCLYVINQEYKLDYWQRETVSLEAEEVLVELNNVEPYSYTGSSEIKVTRDFLTGVFGDYYTIGEIDAFVNRQNDKILPVGTMTLIELLRLIESETGMVFVTRYEKADDSNVIKRYLDLRQVDSIGVTYTQALEIGYNADNLTHSVNETNTYRAIAPKLSLSESDDETSNTSLTKSQLATVISNYKSLAVNKGDRIPMIIEKRQENNEETEVITAYWYAPFNKRSGKLYVEDDAGSDNDYGTTDANYNQIYSKKDNFSVKRIPKIGTVSTSEQNKYAIYNACARALLEKRYPDVEIEIGVADLNLLVGDGSYFYVYDTVYVKIPMYRELVKAHVTKTVKNPNDSGLNRITVSNAKIGTKVTQRDTNISMQDTTVTKKGQKLSGTLFSEGIPLANEIVSISFQKYVEEKTPAIKDTSKSSSRKSTKTKTITEKVKRTDVITAWGYNTCACCGYPKNPYKKVKKTYLNKCPHCGKTMVLKNNPKKVKDGEITCSSCDADYCVNCGGDKGSKSTCRKWKLTPAEEYTTVTRKVDVTSASKKSDSKKVDSKDPTLGTTAQAYIKKYRIHKDIVAKARSICYGKKTDKSKMKAISEWMGLGNAGNVKYQRYECTRRGARKTLRDRKGNCADQTHLCIALARAVGVTARYVHRWNHYYGEYKINGNWFVVDTVTSRGWGHYWSGSGRLISKGNSLKGCKVS